MTFAAIADIHGNLLALEAVLADIGRRRISVVVNLGDLVSGPLWPAETAERLVRLGLRTISGNHERQLLTLPVEQMGPSDRYAIARLAPSHLDWLSTLPATARYGDAFLCHGTPASDLAYFLQSVGPDGVQEAALADIEAKAQVEAGTILCGHTHVPGWVPLSGGRRVVNPGSVGLPAYADDSPYPHVMEAGSAHARYAILSDDGVELVRVEYDREAAARQAERNGRADWAQGLRTGRLT